MVAFCGRLGGPPASGLLQHLTTVVQGSDAGGDTDGQACEVIAPDSHSPVRSPARVSIPFGLAARSPSHA